MLDREVNYDSRKRVNQIYSARPADFQRHISSFLFSLLSPPTLLRFLYMYMVYENLKISSNGDLLPSKWKNFRVRFGGLSLSLSFLPRISLYSQASGKTGVLPHDLLENCFIRKTLPRNCEFCFPNGTVKDRNGARNSKKSERRKEGREVWGLK